MTDIVPWGNGSVGVGVLYVDQVDADPGQTFSPATYTAAFLASTDGLHWTISQLGGLTAGEICGTSIYEGVQYVVATGHELVAVGFASCEGRAPKLWRSVDGRTWTPVDSPVWRAAWTSTPPNALFAVAGGPAGVVAIGGTDRNPLATKGPLKDGPPVILYSADGLTWDSLDPSPAFDDGHLLDVASYAGGFVVVGRIGEADTLRPTPSPGETRPAAWSSNDGRSWHAATVPGDVGPRAGLVNVVAGADGLFATGWRAGAGLDQEPKPAMTMGGGTSGWASPDGLTWRFVGDFARDLPYMESLAGDGSRMIWLGRDSCKQAALSGWSSTDGMTWTRLAFSGSPSIPNSSWGAICRDDGSVDYSGSLGLHPDGVEVVPGGLVVNAYQQGNDATFWFATATGLDTTDPR